MNDKVYIYYSGATDVTGPKLAEILEVSSGKDFPKDKDLVIGWGCKLQKDYKFPGIKKLLNHPNKIRINRNKFDALTKMRQKDVPVADFVKINQANTLIEKNGFPLIGRRNYHQGGKHFWLILNHADLKAAADDGCQYVQSYIDIQDEYRAHVAFGNVIYVARKVAQNNPAKAWKAQRIEKIEQKFDIKFDKLPKEQKELLDKAMDLLAKEHDSPDRIVRSNKRGWKFQGVAPTNVPQAVKDSALAALKAIDLDFGAVDLVLDLNGSPYILEVNSAPGLDGTALEKWTEALQAKIAEETKPKEKPKAKPKAVAAETEEVPVGGKIAESVESVDKDTLKAEILNDILAALKTEAPKPKAKGPQHQKLLDIVQDLEEDGAEGMLQLLSKLKEAGI